MSQLTRYIKQEQRNNRFLLVPLFEVLLDELERNIENKERQKAELEEAKRNNQSRYRQLLGQGFTINECLDVLRALQRESDFCRQQIASDDVPLAVKGADRVLSSAYHWDGRVLDILALLTSVDANQYRWGLGDCKFEIKTNALSLFGDVNHFQDEVAGKFGVVQPLLANDQEPYATKRLVVVCSAVKPFATRAFQNLSLGHVQPPIVRGDYEIVSSKDIVTTIRQLI